MKGTDMSTVSHRLAAHTVADHPVSPELAEWMRLLLLDYHAVTGGGFHRDSAVAARAAIEISEQATAFFPAALHGVDGAGTSGFATVEHAALVNGITAHGLELDDTFEESSLHPAVVIFPAVLALASTQQSPTGEVLRAATVGYDVMCSVGVLLGARESYGRGFHPTGVAGCLGAAAAAARLLGLTVEQTIHALGLAANMASGSLEFLADGSWTKRLNAGHAAATGIRAAKLAAAGFTAPATAIEGRDGFLVQYGAGVVDGRQLALEFGRSALDTSIKFYPCCRYMHGNIDLLRGIREQNPLLGIDDVARIRVGVIQAGASLVSEPAARKLEVNTAVDAQFNMPFGAAVALATGRATVDQFDDAPTVAADLMEWMRKVECYRSDRLEAAFPARWEAEVQVVLWDGTVIEKSEDSFRGAPGDRATWADIVQKAEALIGITEANALAVSISRLGDATVLGGGVAVSTGTLADSRV
ncbi:MmgE/PrpD family protein [Cryobacterium gelidum]|uniref:MmgE/PrpD family protein n=2 Tax=Cryobacterium gelidum TaxID=1259164 RepID=A0A4R9AYZ3_9MICO|nr:MmgE/PrpD family protein [Cryobacterium gelidum]